MNWQQLAHTEAPIVLYGMGNGAERILNELANRGISASGIFASDEFVRGQTFRGFRVQTYAELHAQFPDAVILLAFGTHQKDVMEKIRILSKQGNLYAPPLPVCEGTLFDQPFEQKHAEELQTVYNRLADALSKKVFQSVLDYRRTWDVSHLFSCQSPIREAYEHILRLGERETLLDLGAYRGDTVLEFLRYAKSYDRILAVEPDGYCYKKLLKTVENIPNVTCVHAAIGEAVGTTLFCSKGGRGSHAGEGLPISMESVDNLCKNTPVTFINIDVEGFEAAAIRGAQKTILRDKPKILLSAYHRTEDLFSLVPQILAIRPDYRVCLRHHEAIPDWDTNFYLI